MATKAPLVLVPGLGADAGDWPYQIDHLADIAEITVADLRSCASRAQMGEVVLSATSGPFALAGHSMGGWAAQEAAARAPQRVTRLALLNTWARSDTAAIAAQRRAIAMISQGHFEEFLDKNLPRIVHPDRAGDAGLRAALKAMQRRAGPEVFARHLGALVNDADSRALLPLIRCPTLVVAARQDAYFSVEEHEFLAAVIAGARLAILEECGHSSTLEQPQAVTNLLRDWLTDPYAPLSH
jgi:pimeloyl-ACP methyl ester carboxylesterase